MSASLAEQFLARSPAERETILAGMSQEELTNLHYHWPFWARPEQLLPPGDWRVWMPLAGRGWGKTRTGAETVRHWAKTNERVNIMGATADDARDIMIEGESGILAVCPKHERPNYVKFARKLVWPSGCISLIFTADEPDRLRGKQHAKFWADEVAAWRYIDAWDQAIFGLRLGHNPQAIVTTTPRPTKLIRDIMASPKTIVTRGSTRDNQANLATGFIHDLIKKYEGTRLGRQELEAEILDDVPGALWNRSILDKHRVDVCPPLKRIVISIDPAVSNDPETSAETGIIVAGVDELGIGYVVDDATLRSSPHDWATEAVAQYKARRADCIVAEVNNGGDLVEATIRTVDASVKFKKVHATRGKFKRAEPIAALYEQGRVRHVGHLGKLEDQLCAYDPATQGKSGTTLLDRMDAAVWALTELMVDEESTGSGLAPASGWKIWKPEKPPVCSTIIASSWSKTEPHGVVSAMCVWGLFRHSPGPGNLVGKGEERVCAVLLESRELAASAPRVQAELTAMAGRHNPEVLILPRGDHPWFMKHLRREVNGVMVKQLQYDEKVSPQVAAEVLTAGLAWRPDKPWADQVAYDFQRYPYGDREAIAHALSLGLLYLRRMYDVTPRTPVPETPQEEVNRGAIYA